MMEKLGVRLVSPAMIGGAVPRKCDDPPTLRVPELRGLLRFWTRALGGPGFRELEETLWGSTRVGQRVTIRATSVGGPAELRHPDQPLFPHKPRAESTPTQMIAPGAHFELRFGVPDLGPAYRERLQAVVWTALHLGAVGRRSRRGYGSLQWLPRPGDLLTGFLETPFDPTTDLASETALQAYVLRGLTRVCSILGRPAVTVPPTARTSGNWFELRTVDQVFVGKALAAGYNGQPGGMEELIHGFRRPTQDPESIQLGTIVGMRLASPMLWRVYHLTGGSFVPVMTWSPREGVNSLTPGTGMHGYLSRTLGFSLSLAGLPLQR